MKNIKKYWFIIAIVLIIFIRFLYSYKLPSFYMNGMLCDDQLMVNQFRSLLSGNYLGDYNEYTLVKGMIYPLLLFLSHIIHLSYSSFFTLLFISSCLYFILSLKKIINNKKILLLIFILLLFNPISYSTDLFQRLYRNSISIIELLFFLGTIIRIVSDKNNKILNYIILGLIISIMYLTREDNIWILPILLFVFIYKLYKNVKIKNILINLIPIFILILSLNIVSFINYKHYGVYTYNELKKSSFKDAYINILRIKEDKKYDKVSINKETFEKIIDNSDILGFDKEYLNEKYRKLATSNNEIDNGNIVWYLRRWIYANHEFKDANDANKYFKKLSKEIDRLFKEKKLEKEKILPSVFINTPRVEYIKKIPSSFINAIVYTSTYKNIRTLDSLRPRDKIIISVYNEKIDAYAITYMDYRHTDEITDNNPLKYEIIRIIYKYLTIIFSLVSLVIYFINIKKFDTLGIIINILLLSYFIIISGVVYTDVSAYHAIRYMYLGNIYIIQELFIILNLYRYYDNKKIKEKKEKELKKKKKKTKKK